MMLAQLTPEMTVYIPYILVGLGALLWMTNESIKLVKTIKGKPGDPPNESLGIAHTELKRRVGVVEDGVSDLQKKMIGAAWFQKIDHDLATVQAKNEEYRQLKEVHDSQHRKDVYEKMDSVRKEMKDDLIEQTKDLSQRIDNMPSQIVAILKNTNAI